MGYVTVKGVRKRYFQPLPDGNFQYLTLTDAKILGSSVERTYLEIVSGA